MTRRQALEWIRVYAAHGDMSSATRVWLDHRIPRAAYNQAVRDGIARRERFARREAAKENNHAPQ